MLYILIYLFIYFSIITFNFEPDVAIKDIDGSDCGEDETYGGFFYGAN